MEITFICILLIVAYLYASVGHGGATGYLALMALFSVPTIYMKATALTLNLFVAGIAFINYYRAGYFKPKILIPFVIGSIPLAFIGAKVEIDAQTYKIILALFLIIAVWRMLFSQKTKEQKTKTPKFFLAVFIGMMLGLFSGMIGIGGGIILSPLILLLNWANVKEAAAISAMFIFLNSTSGLIGSFSGTISLHPQIGYWIVAGILGGITGSYSSSYKFSFSIVRYLLASVLIMASLKLFII